MWISHQSTGRLSLLTERQAVESRVYFSEQIIGYALCALTNSDSNIYPDSSCWIGGAWFSTTKHYWTLTAQTTMTWMWALYMWILLTVDPFTLICHWLQNYARWAFFYLILYSITLQNPKYSQKIRNSNKNVSSHHPRSAFVIDRRIIRGGYRWWRNISQHIVCSILLWIWFDRCDTRMLCFATNEMRWKNILMWEGYRRLFIRFRFLYMRVEQIAQANSDYVMYALHIWANHPRQNILIESV